MSRQRDVRLIIRELMDMEEYKYLSYNDILNVVYWGQFGFIHKTISSGDNHNSDSYKTIRLSNLGTFVAHPKKIQSRVNKIKAREEARDEGNS